MENYLRKELEAGNTVSIKIDVGYSAGSGVRPTKFIVTGEVDGQPFRRSFEQ